MMSDRERWIVYPLLALSLALGVKGRYDAWRGTSEFNVLVCRTLLVQNELGEAQAVIQQNQRGAAELNLAGPDGLVEASLTADEGGGRLVLLRRADQKAIALGHDKMRELTGLWAVDQNAAAVNLPLLIETDDDHAWRLLDWPITRTKPRTKPKKETPAQPEAKPSDE